MVCKLNKALYGLKQSPRAWFGRFRTVMRKYGFKQSNSDHTLLLKRRMGKLTTLIVYVDDMIVTGDDKEEISSLKDYSATKFEMKDLGGLKCFLGIEVARSKQGIFLSQRTYVFDLLAETGMLDCKQESPCPKRTHIASSVGQEFFKADCWPSSIGSLDNDPFIKWHPPDNGFVKLNFDGYVSNAKTGPGFIVRNEDGFVIGVGAFNLNGATINEAEARALKEGLAYIKRKGFTKIIIEGDSKLIIEAFQGTVEPPWNTSTCLDDIKWFASACLLVIWKHTFRETNFLADAFAKQRLTSSNSHFWEYRISNFACAALLFDSLGSGSKCGFLF
nr:uncharacterized protein LOC114826287 [Malus domestica]